MYLQKRVYKYPAKKVQIQHQIDSMASTSRFRGYWIDENNFILKHKSPFVLFAFEGNIEEIEQRSRLEIFITADYRYFLLYVFPIGFIFYGILKWSSAPDSGLLLTFIGVSLSVFIFLFSSVALNSLKRNFKEALQLM